MSATYANSVLISLSNTHSLLVETRNTQKSVAQAGSHKTHSLTMTTIVSFCVSFKNFNDEKKNKRFLTAYAT